MIYFDNAATSRYKPLASVLTGLKFSVKSANPGRGAHKDAIDAAIAVEETREILSEHYGGMNVVLTKNCTEAICAAIRGLKLRGEAVLSPFEHNAVLRTLERESKNGLRSVFLSPEANGEITVKSVEKAITSATKLVVLTKMNNVTGRTVDETEIGKFLKSKRILFLLDVAQAAGHIAIDPKYCDVIVSSGHKGLHGPAGTGFFAYKKQIRIEPLLTGGTGSGTLSLKQPENYPDGFEAGTQSAANFAALGKAAEWTFHNEGRIAEKLHRLSFALYEGIEKIPNTVLYSVKDAPLVTFNVAGKTSNEVAELLSERYCIAARAGLHCAPLTHKFLGTEKTGAVRASVGLNNSLREVRKLIKAVREISEMP